MKILHLCLSNFYIDNYCYQENAIPRVNKEDGNEVYIIASTETFLENNHLGYTQPGFYYTEYGVPIKRLPYRKVFSQFLTRKIRAYFGLYDEIAKFCPDVIMMHDIAFWSVREVVRYKKQNPQVKLYADTHTASYNSGRNWFSLHILHRLFYRRLIRSSLPYLEKYFYIGESERIFNEKNYGVSPSMMEYLPLGGFLYSESEYLQKRFDRRKELGVATNQRLYIHSGKLNALKRTKELVEAFIKVRDENARLVIVGSISDNNVEELRQLFAKDDRIRYLGWKSSEELREYLCACDLYCQPGSVSATMQNAVCCDCAIMAYPHLPYTTYLDWGNILWVKTQEDMENVFKSISEAPEQLNTLKDNSHKCAVELLDYRKLAARLYEK